MMSHFDFNQWLGFTTRYDFFNDKGGTRLGSGFAEKRNALTYAPTINFGHGMQALMEFRFDTSTKNVFPDGDGGLSKMSSNLAFEMIYSF